MSIYQSIFEHAVNLTVLNRVTGVCEEVAPAAATVLGYTPGQVIGKSFFEFVPAASVGEVKTAFVAAAANGKHRIVDHPLKMNDGRLKWVRTIFKKIDEDTVVSWSNEIESEKQLEEAMRTLYVQYHGIEESDFFRGLVSNLARILRVDYAFITRTANTDNTRVEMLAFWNGTDFGVPFSYDLKGTPCDAVINDSKVCYYPTNVQKVFPNDKDLVTLNAQSYVGVPIRDQRRQVLGHLAILDIDPLRLIPREQLILESFASRAAFMLEKVAS